jgi:lipopolysaccharide/colanic/teichoic acid biosynthesis glycosyltransferase
MRAFRASPKNHDTCELLHTRHDGPEGRFHRSETTRVGRFLRYTRIDTLPQLMNVLRGEMTVIGTGAERFEFLDAA